MAVYKSINDIPAIQVYEEVNPSAKGLWDKYGVDQSERDYYKYYGYGEEDVYNRIQELAKRYGYKPQNYGTFEEAQLSLIADLEHAYPDLYEKKWGHPYHYDDGENITPDYLRDLAKIRARSVGGDVNKAEQELRALWGKQVAPNEPGVRTLGEITEANVKAKNQDKYNKKKGLGKYAD